MQDNKSEFYLISLLSTYLLIKDKYPEISEIDGDKEDVIVKLLTEKLSELSKHAFLPNKSKIISDSYQNVITLIEDGQIDEEKFFDFVKGEVASSSYDEKVYMLNCVIYLAHHNEKISKSERESILQAAHFLGLDSDYKVIMRNYQKSEFVEKIPLAYKLIAFSVGIVLMLLATYFLTQQAKNNIRIFDQKSVVFNEVNFNRLVIYKNKFNVTNEYSLKQALFHIHGSAEVSFDPRMIKYDNFSKQLTLSYKGENPFDLDIDASYNLIDLIDPEPIGSAEAAKISAVVGVAGAVAGGIVGNKLGNMIGTVLPSSASFMSSVVGTVSGATIGGAGAAYMTFSTLDGMQINHQLGQRETTEVIANSLKLIEALLLADPDLEVMYKSNFEIYIKDVYLTRGLEVNSIEYKRVEK